jgi:hypothetical protein
MGENSPASMLEEVEGHRCGGLPVNARLVELYSLHMSITYQDSLLQYQCSVVLFNISSVPLEFFRDGFTDLLHYEISL